MLRRCRERVTFYKRNDGETRYGKMRRQVEDLKIVTKEARVMKDNRVTYSIVILVLLLF